MSEEELLEILKTRLSLNIRTTSNYNGGMDGGSMYTENHVIELLLDNCVISEVSL